MKRIRRGALRRSRRQAAHRRRNSCREVLEPRLVLDVSAPPILQWFEGSYNTIEQRVPDIFAGHVKGIAPSELGEGGRNVRKQIEILP